MSGTSNANWSIIMPFEIESKILDSIVIKECQIRELKLSDSGLSVILQCTCCNELI